MLIWGRWFIEGRLLFKEIRYLSCVTVQTNDFYLCLSLLKQLCLTLHGSVKNGKIITLSSRSTMDLIARYDSPEQVNALHNYASGNSKYGHAEQKWTSDWVQTWHVLPPSFWRFKGVRQMFTCKVGHCFSGLKHLTWFLVAW